MDESGREYSLNLNSTIPHISHDYSEKYDRADSRCHIGSYVGPYFEIFHENNQDFTLHNTFAKPLS